MEIIKNKKINITIVMAFFVIIMLLILFAINMKKHVKADNSASFLSGNNFVIGSDENIITSNELLYRGRVEAKDKDGQEINIKDLKVNSSELQSLNNAIRDKKDGNYPITISNGLGETHVIYAVVRQHSSGVLPRYSSETSGIKVTNGTIGGNDFTLSNTSNKYVLTRDDIISNSDVLAFDRNGKQYKASDIIVNQNMIEEINLAIKNQKSGIYPMLLDTPKGERIQIKIGI
ncbi:MAG: hypothetical protein LBM02_04990 [Lachnospiraceae bacterium]|jgi:dipeptidyl aminopeptidase/acylaminoacyl peptidase|nr:hypothetical protein [Lachnospiraceae bacterium]